MGEDRGWPGDLAVFRVPVVSVWSLYFAGIGLAANNGCVPIDAAESTWPSVPLVDMRSEELCLCPFGLCL